MVDLKSRSRSLAVGTFLFASTVLAHGHDMDKIEEGQAMSAEPLVCRIAGIVGDDYQVADR